MWVSTFHSACVRILRRDASRLGYPSAFTIYDQADAVRLTGYVIRDLDIDPKRFPPRSVHAAISAAKNEGITAEQYAERASVIHERRIADVFTEYQIRLRRAGAMDFDDLLGVTVELLRTEPEVLAHYRERFRHVLVDEYQDTNPVQNELVLLLTQEHRNVCVVGDTDQSIYAFRSADIRNILEFEKTFPDATVVVLEQNYRSTQTILDAANAVIAHNVARKPKDLWTESGRGDKIVRFHGEDESDEAQWVTHEISTLHDGGDLRWSDIAVFFRTNAQSRVVEEQFLRSGIPYRVVGGTRFYDRREVKDALAYLKAVVNPTDEVSIKRVLNVPKRGVGDQTVGRLDAYAHSRGITFMDALRRWDDAGSSPARPGAIESFLTLVDELATEVDDGPAALLESILAQTGYSAELEAERTIEAEGRLENLAELVGVARDHETVDEFLEQVSLVADTDSLPDESDPSDTGVVLMTLHAAKGLEFPVVFLCGMEEGVFPHMRSLTEPAELEEERRLCYVGITRARQRLYLSHAVVSHAPRQHPVQPAQPLPRRDPRRAHRGGRREPVGGGRRSARSGGWDSTSWSPRGRDRQVDRAVRPAPPSQSGAHLAGIRTGDDVRHAKWGDGVVLLLEGSGEKAEAVVNFPSVGEKRLLLSWAPIERVTGST